MPNKIFIPKSCEHTQALRVIVDPPSDNMAIQLCDIDTETPFQEGKIEGRRGREIAIFLFRPMKVIQDGDNIRMQEHLKKGDKVLVKVQALDSDKKVTTAEQEVEVL